MTRVRGALFRLTLACFALVFPALAHAQSRTTAAVRGTVNRSDGSPVPDVLVTVEHMSTGSSRTVATNAEGRYLLLQLNPGGPYRLRVQSIGFAEAQRDSLMLQVGEITTINVTLTEQAIVLEGFEADVERAEIFNPSQVGPATLLDERVVESVPILSRDLMELAVLSPLVKTTDQGGFSVAGQNDRYNAILIDGILSKDMFGNTAGGVPGGAAGAKLIPLDAVAQYEILVAPFDVRLSGFTGGVMNAVTKTGSNEWWSRAHAVHRTEALIGDLSLPTGPVEASGVDRSLFGLSVGGPVIRDVAHFFVSSEFEWRNQPPTGYNLERDDPNLVRITTESIEDFKEAFDDRFGLRTGLAGPYPLEQELANVFARVDWELSPRHRMTVRNLFASAKNDESPNRFFYQPYGLSSNAVHREGLNNITSFQLFSDFGRTGANELKVSVQKSSDRSTPAATYPQVEIDLISNTGDATFQRALRAGSQFFAQDSDLDQTMIRVTNALSLNKDPSEGEGSGSTYTLGLTGAWYDFGHRFLPGAEGDYFYASIGDLRNNAPQRYQRTILAPGEDPVVDFQVIEWGAFVQNQIDAGKGLTMRFGLRIDMPHVLDQPERNPEVQDAFGINTSTVPSGLIMVSPRWGFNWQSEGDLTTQVRGGAGMFTGQLPFVWLSNAFQNNGLRSVTAWCEGRVTDDPTPGSAVPPFVPGTVPTACLNSPFREIRTITAFDPDFKYPRDLKFAATVDQELSSTLSGTLGFLFNKAINQIVLREENLGDPAGAIGPVEGYGGFERRYYGRPTDNGFEPTWDNPAFGHVLLATNESEDWAFSFSAELRGQLTERLAFQSGYAFARAYDKMSLVSTDMVSNYGFNPVDADPNQPTLTTSNFDRPHKVVLSVYGSPFPGLDDTEISLLYTGQSGLPFSYVYDGDLNGDGYPGRGPAFDRTNDLIYVPMRASELPSTPVTQGLLGRALESDACLRENRGDIMLRNKCRAPWQNRLDLRVSQSINVGGTQLSLQADLINVLNLVNNDWGKLETVRPVVQLIEPIRRVESLTGVGELLSTWAGGIIPSREGGRLEATDPWAVLSPDSQWQMQFGLRATFGGGN